MSISHKELMALRRAHLAEKEKQQGGPTTSVPVTQPGLQPPKTVIAMPPQRAMTTSITSPSRIKEKEPKSEGGALDRYRKLTNASLHPKVFSPFQTVQGHVPRQECIRRKRVSYEKTNIEAKLAEQGIDYYRDGIGGMVDEAPGGRSLYHRLLPLEAFDDFEFDEFAPVDWLEKGKDAESGEQLGVPCLAVFVDDDSKGRWLPGRVLDWAVEEHRLLVQFDDSKRQTWLSRIHVYFRAEDPENFVKRVVSAFERRKEAEAILRYNIYVESMPIDDYQMLDEVATERIRDLSINTNSLLNNEDTLDIQSVLKEINAEYGRAMNKKLFDQATSENSLTSLFQGTPVPKPKPKEKAAAFGQVQLPPRNFGNVVRAFHTNTYLNHQDEVILVGHRVRDECDQILLTNIFVVPPQLDTHRPLILDDFEELQSTSITQRVMMLKDQWSANIKEIVKDSLENTSAENEVNLHITSKEEYEGTKLQRLMTTVKFMMQDTLYYLMTASLESYVRFIETCSNYHVEIADLATVSLRDGPLTVLPIDMGHDRRPNTAPDAKPPLPPLFKVQLKQEDKKVTYTTPAPEFCRTIVSIFDKGITQHQDLPQIEQQVFEFIYNNAEPSIGAIGLQHPLVDGWRTRLSDAVNHAVYPLLQYLETYKPFQDLMEIDEAHYLHDYEAANHPVKTMEKEVEKHYSRQKDVQKMIPSSVNLGTFLVDCADFRRMLSEKCASLAKGVLEILAKVARKKAEEIDDKFGEIRACVKCPVDSHQDVINVKEYMKTIPEKVLELRDVIKEMTDVDDVLDRFQAPLNDDDFTKKWKSIGWPSSLDETIVRVNSDLEIARKALNERQEKDHLSFLNEIERLRKLVGQFFKKTDIKRVSETASDVKTILNDLEKAKKQAAEFNNNDSLFDMEKKDYSEIHQIAKDFEPYASLWITADNWIQWHHGWTNDAFENIDAEEMEKNVMDAAKKMAKVVREPKFKDKPLILKIAEDIKTQIDEFKPVIPTVKFLRTQGMKDRHWATLTKELTFEVHPKSTLLTLNDVYSLDLQLHEQTIMKISEIAGREYAIETTLIKMKKDWDDVKMNVKAYKKTGCFILGKDTMDDTQELLDDHMLNTQALNFNPDKKLFEQQIDEWDQYIKLVQNVFDEWKECQKSWMYLEPIFQSEDIVRQLPAEAKRFSQVNKNWKFLTNKAQEVNFTMPFCMNTDKCLEMFKECNDLLEKVQKGLNQYLENKRSAFARFYFLSDDELLTILSEAKDPQKIQPHFRKLFENVHKIDMRNPPENEMFGMYSQMGEYVAFEESVFPRKNVENWLTDIEHMMKRSVWNELSKGLKATKTMPRKEFILKFPGQVVIAVNQMLWTAECERHFKEFGSLDRYVEASNSGLMLLVETVRMKLTSLQQMNLGGLITIEVHARDIVEQLAKEKITDAASFEWVSQLRSYWRDEACYIQQIEAVLPYGGEYLGNTTRLVITPLTDRIYLTLTGAMHMFKGGAPAGPAGTGKTETVKDLAKAVAKQCVVFNCQEGLTFAAMGKFFKGLAQAGAWACFDEFNRIDVEVLSVVAQQVSSLQEAAKTKNYRISFEGTEIVVDPTHCVFITMNPGYAGRTELPDNLKVLFRPVACMVPNYAMIAEIRLFSFGYADSRKLAQKMVATFRLSSEQLSAQDHYDFGMRAVNTVISAAGLMKQRSPDDEEDILLLRALRDSNAPKFLAEDLILFSGIISDLFPGIKMPVPDYGNFLKVLQEKCKQFELQPTDAFTKKCVETYEMMILRHGQMSVGPTMGGKSSATKVLRESMTKLKKEMNQEYFDEVLTFFLNPKSITMSQLYGGFDEATGEWRDGLIGELFRLAASENLPIDARKWIIFDGPVDALWIESMNTVLDDNKKLCLVSGEIIAMTPKMSVWFEVEDLAVASPATVSRAGMIYLEPLGVIGVENFIKSWQMYKLPKVMDVEKQELERLCNTLFPSIIQFVQSSCVEYQQSVWPNLVQSCFNIYNAFMTPFIATRTYEPAPEVLDNMREIYVHLLVFSMVWSFGATCDPTSRKKFDKFFREELKRAGVTISIPDLGLLYDYEFIPAEKRWISWTERAPPFNTTVTSENFAEIIIPTSDVIRYKYMIKHLLIASCCTLCVGPTGTGKSLLLQELLMKDMPKEFTPIFFTFSARTNANQTQDLIHSKFEVRRRASPQIFGAPIGKKFVIYVDDLNMPLREFYGAQPPIELLRQWMDYHGWYDRKNREFYSIVDIMFVSAMGPPGGGRNKVSNRLLRHFNFIAFPEVEDESVKVIFSTILESFMKGQGFGDEVRTRIQSIVESSIEIFNTITKELRPRPSRPHYLFNMRDLGKMFSGILSAEAKIVTTTAQILKLWLHECTRTFRDRLIDDTDRGWFDELLKKQLQKHFRLKWNEVVTTERLLYADFLNSSTDIRVYDEAKDQSQLISVMEHQLEEYNHNTMKKMNLVMFMDCIEHACKVARITRKPGGHALLLGVGGSGRQSVSRLAAHINGFEVTQVEIQKGYTINMWKEYLKSVLRRTSFKNEQLVFLITDTQCVQESMLEDVNNLLNAGEVPNLLVGPELDEVMDVMKGVCSKEGIPLDKVNMYSRFVKFSKTNLHAIVCMSPIGETFRSRLRMFPALVNCCTIDWFSNWPSQALVSVARDFFDGVSSVKDPQLVDSCIKMCVHIHKSVEDMSAIFLEETKRHNYVTPTSYLELLETFKTLMSREFNKIVSKRNQLSNGLEKLRETEIAVAELQQNLEHDQPLLLQRQEEIVQMVEEIAKETESAEERKAVIVEDEKSASEKTDQCTAYYKETEEVLAQAIPALEASLEALDSLKTSHFNEVYNYKSPTQGVVLTMQGVCIMFKIGPVMKAPNPQYPDQKVADYWGPGKELLAKPNDLLYKLKNYDRDNIPQKLIDAITPMINSSDFTPEKIKGASQACAAMCQWCHAMHKYHYINLQVQPLRDALAVAKAELQATQEKLEEKRTELKAIVDKLDTLKRNQENAEKEKQVLETKVEKTKIQLKRAGKLIEGLAGEKKNWNSIIGQLTEREKYLTGDVLAGAGQVSYNGAFTTKYRVDLLDNWKKELDRLGILHSPQLSTYFTLQDPVEFRTWSINSLPADQLSIENAQFLFNARRWPLMIDPQLQANIWIRKTYGEALEIVRPTTKDMIKKIEFCISGGRPVLLENVTEDIDPSLEPLLSKQTFRSGGIEMIKISDKAVQWNNQFKFFMTSKLSNPHYIPEVMVKVTLLNFFITPIGLEDQLLGVLVGEEKKELEVQKNQLVTQNAQMKNEIAEIQATILRKLEEVKGDILDDESLIEYLDQSKVKSAEINEKVAEAEITEKEIDATREEYRPVAFHSSILYFVCSDLANVDPMYQYSLQWFRSLFVGGINGAERNDSDIQERLKNLKEYFTFSFFQNISRSLFERHKLMFAFILCIRIMQGANLVDAQEYRFLLNGATSIIQGAKNPAPEWLTDVTWVDLIFMDNELPCFKDICSHVASNVEHYHNMFMSADAHTEAMAGSWAGKLSSLQRMLFTRCLRPDKLMAGVQDFVSKHIGERFTKPPGFNLATSFADSDFMHPLIFVLSAGADPYEEWKKFAEERKLPAKKLADISLGQGQGPRAERMLREGMDAGNWVLLQNCHLATSWMSTLERETERMASAEGIHTDFRLWLTSMPNPRFPVSILQNGVKMTNEPPKGMLANVARSIRTYPNSVLDKCKKPKEFKKIVFSLCFFHALIQERRKFGALGWNIPYEYTSGDLDCCVTQLQMFLDKYAEVPFKVIKELTGQIHYGGRVTDDWDKRTITTILEVFVNADVLEDGYKFSPSGIYNSISPVDQQTYLEYVESWPLNTAPEAFGLHENADITCARNETFDTLATMVLLQGAGSTKGAGKSPDEVVTELASGIFSKIRAEFDIAKMQEKYPTIYEDSMNTVLVQEAIRFNKLISVLRSSLQNIQLAIKGMIVMSKDLEELYNSMFNNVVPTMWADKAYPSMKPLASWVIDLVARLQMIEKWYDKGHPKAYWISGFYFPQAFLTGILQNYARHQQKSIDTISYSYEWMDKGPETLTEPPPSGCYIFGMYMEGARIDHTSLKMAESRPKILYEMSPMLWLIPTINREGPDGIYVCPLYKTLRRAGTLSTTGHSTNYVLSVEIVSDEPAAHWIKRGVALLCALAY